jgi:biotin operon repressor
MNGWISLHRQFLNWEWYDDINTKSVFIHLLLIANHKKANWRGIEIDQGQTFTSVKHLAFAVGLSEKQIRNSIKKLKKTGEIETRGANNGTLISIINYSTYQNIELIEGKQKGKRGANKGQTKGKQRATNNKKNKDNNKNKNNKLFKEECYSKDNLDKYGKAMIEEFYLFYSEETQDGKMMKRDTFKTWSTSGRLVTWSKKDYNGYYKMHKDELFRKRHNKVNEVDESEIDPEGLNNYMSSLSKTIGRS